MRENKEQGALSEAVFFILLALREPRHGYGIMQWAMEATNGRVVLGAGTLYGALNTLLERGWIRMDDFQNDSRRKNYRLTDLGRSVLNTELERLAELLKLGSSVTGGARNDTQGV